MGKEVRPDPKEEVIARGEDILKNSRVEASNLGPLAKLQPFQPIIIRVMQLLDREEVNNDEVGRLIESDPALTAELLGVVNSPLYALNSKVNNPIQALGLLGFQNTKSLATTLGMRFMMRGAPKTPVVRRFWIHSVATATMSQQFARSFRVDPAEAHIGALLHDLGRLGLLAAYPDEYSAFALSAHDSAAAILAGEQEKFGMTHCRAGLMLAEAWSLPETVRRVAGLHHETNSDQPIVMLVQLCCRLADAFQFQAIFRADVEKPEEAIATFAPEPLREQLTSRLETVNKAILTALESLDF
jgi:putative nucleotidyltransferase with HDIG domain